MLIFLIFQNGDSPLHIAAAMGRRKLVRILLESSQIDMELKNQQNEMALDIAARKNHQEIVAMIRHPPPVRKTTELTKAEINVTLDVTDDIKHSKKVSTCHWLMRPERHSSLL